MVDSIFEKVKILFDQKKFPEILRIYTEHLRAIKNYNGENKEELSVLLSFSFHNINEFALCVDQSNIAMRMILGKENVKEMMELLSNLIYIKADSLLSLGNSFKAMMFLRNSISKFSIEDNDIIGLYESSKRKNIPIILNIINYSLGLILLINIIISFVTDFSMILFLLEAILFIVYIGVLLNQNRLKRFVELIF